ncbi:MAG: OsmC family protein [Caldilineaceae bacterium]
MQSFPHHYRVNAAGEASGVVLVSAKGLPDLPTNAPAEFDGPGDQWSPETMLVAAVANCFILTFRAIAQYSKFEWHALSCDVTGILDRVDRVTQFTEMQLTVILSVPTGTEAEKAQRLLEKAEQNCLITNSLRGKVEMKASVQIE